MAAYVEVARLSKQISHLKLSDREIGRGAYGVVCKGTFYSCPVAVKTIHKSIAQGKPLEDFKIECKILSELGEHPNIVKSYGAFENVKGEPMLVLELLKENLREHLERNKGQLCLERELEICLDIASGFKFLHERKVAHRDGNDKNILITEDGTAKITDLGQSKLLNAVGEYMTTTAPGAMLFMPPEALKEDGSHFNLKVDVFSVGVLMLEVATQCFPSVNVVGIGTIPEVTRRKGDLQKLPDDHPLKSLIIWCLQDDYSCRPDMSAVYESIHRLTVRESTNYIYTGELLRYTYELNCNI